MKLDQYDSDIPEDFGVAGHFETENEQLYLLSFDGRPGYIAESEDDWRVRIPSDLKSEEVKKVADEEGLNYPVEQVPHFLHYSSRYSEKNDIGEVGRGAIHNTLGVPEIDRDQLSENAYELSLTDYSLEIAENLREETKEMLENYDHKDVKARDSNSTISKMVKLAEIKGNSGLGERLSSCVADIAMYTGTSALNFGSPSSVTQLNGNSATIDLESFNSREQPYVQIQENISRLDPDRMTDREIQKASALSMHRFEEVNKTLSREQQEGVKNSLELSEFGERVAQNVLDGGQPAYGKILFAEAFEIDPQSHELSELDLEKFEELRTNLSEEELKQASKLYDPSADTEFDDTELPKELKQNLNKSNFQKLKDLF